MDIFDNLKIKKVSKGTILLHKGEISSAYKVVKGCLKSYVLDKAGKEHILQFAPEGWFISDPDSFFNSKPATIFIDAIEDSEILVLTTSTFEHLNQNLDYHILTEYNNRLLRNMIASNRRLINLLSATAEERYIDFTETYPALMQRLPLKLIASYLGITPEYLSDVRKKLTRK